MRRLGTVGKLKVVGEEVMLYICGLDPLIELHVPHPPLPTRGATDLPRGADSARLKAFLCGPQGLMRNLAIPMLSYFRPGFHPWDDDNRELLAGMDSIEAAYAA